MRVVRNKITRVAQLLTRGVRYPRYAKRALGALYQEIAYAEGNIPPVAVGEFFSGSGSERRPVCLYDFFPRDGNLGVSALVFVSSCVSLLAPKVVFEIGTFDGNTTLQIAANAPPSTVVYTLDLPDDAQGSAVAKIDPNDAVFIDSKATLKRRYVDTPYASRIIQKFGNSLDVDFGVVLDGRKADLIFIDAGHSYECVKNDTEKALRVLNNGGLIIWDDYTTHWPGVSTYLNELSDRLPLRRVVETSLVVYRDR